MLQVCQLVKNGERPRLPDHLNQSEWSKSKLNQSESSKVLRDLILQCWHQDPTSRPTCSDILKTLSCLSFPDNWKTLLNKKKTSQIEDYQIKNDVFGNDICREVINQDVVCGNVISRDVVCQDVDEEPRKPISFVRSFSLPTPPPLPPAQKPEIKIRENRRKEKQKSLVVIEKPKFSISCDDICKQRQRLRRSDDVKSKLELKEDFNSTLQEDFNSTLIEDLTIKSRFDFDNDLTSVLKRVIEKRRRESGWIFNDEATSTSSDGLSRCSSRISSNVH